MRSLPSALSLQSGAGKSMPIQIGVLALQGDFREHSEVLRKLGCRPVEIRKKEDLKTIKGLIIPGGESTTISKLLKEFKLNQNIIELHKKGIPIYGTCAGAIVLAKDIHNYPKQPSLGLINISIDRNAYGRQIESFEENISIRGEKKPFPAIFIRAPIIKEIGKNVEILAKQNGNPVLIKEDSILVSTFHPELTEDTRIHKMFLEMIKKAK